MQIYYEYKHPDAIHMAAFQAGLIDLGLDSKGFYLPLYVAENKLENSMDLSIVAVQHNIHSGAIEGLVFCTLAVDEEGIYISDSLLINTISEDKAFIAIVVKSTVPLSQAEIIDFQLVYEELLGAKHIPIAKVIQKEFDAIEYLVVSQIVMPNAAPYAQWIMLKTV